MKSKDIQNIARSKYQIGDTPTEIHRRLNGRISLASIKRWYQTIRQSDSIRLLDTSAAVSIVRVLKSTYKELKTVCTENRRCQLEHFRESSVLLRNKCQKNVKIDLGVKLHKMIIANYYFQIIKRSNKNRLQTGFEQISDKKIPQGFCFLINNSLPLVVSIILKMNVCRQ